MNKKILNICYLGSIFNGEDMIDRGLRSIINLSQESSMYVHDEISVAYPVIGPLHFDFLSVALVIKCNTGILLWEQIEKPLILESVGVLVDFGTYHLHRSSGHHLFFVAATKIFKKPTVYIISEEEQEVDIEHVRSINRLEESDALMINNFNNPNNFKEILQRLVELISGVVDI